MDTPRIELGTFRMQSGHSTTELRAHVRNNFWCAKKRYTKIKVFDLLSDSLIELPKQTTIQPHHHSSQKTKIAVAIFPPTQMVALQLLY